MPAIAPETYQRHRITIAEYHRMGEAGVFPPEARMELLDGEMIDMAPIGSRHAGTVNRLAEIMMRALAGSAILSVRNPVVLNEQTELQPDITVLRAREDYYETSHPRPVDVFLVIEVAETTLSYDRGIKHSRYARAGIPEVWLIDLGGRTLSIFREPEGDFYREEETLTDPGALTLRALPDCAIDLTRLFGS